MTRPDELDAKPNPRTFQAKEEATRSSKDCEDAAEETD